VPSNVSVFVSNAIAVTSKIGRLTVAEIKRVCRASCQLRALMKTAMMLTATEIAEARKIHLTDQGCR
jgi:hypothetical protein